MDEGAVTAAEHVAKCRLGGVQLPGLEGLDACRRNDAASGRRQSLRRRPHAQQAEQTGAETQTRRNTHAPKTKGVAPGIDQTRRLQITYARR